MTTLGFLKSLFYFVCFCHRELDDVGVDEQEWWIRTLKCKWGWEREQWWNWEFRGAKLLMKELWGFINKNDEQ